MFTVQCSTNHWYRGDGATITAIVSSVSDLVNAAVNFTLAFEGGGAQYRFLNLTQDSNEVTISPISTGIEISVEVAGSVTAPLDVPQWGLPLVYEIEVIPVSGQPMTSQGRLRLYRDLLNIGGGGNPGGGGTGQYVLRTEVGTLVQGYSSRLDEFVDEIADAPGGSILTATANGIEFLIPSISTFQGSAIASTNLSALRVVTFNSSGQLIYASNATAAHAHRAIAFLLTAVNEAEQTDIYWMGRFEDSSWNWNPATPIFLGSNGLLTQTPPLTGFVRAIAQPLTATAIFFEPEEAINL